MTTDPLAGCELGDLERLVLEKGLEGALGVLFRQGVYLSIEEFKGRQPVVRGRATFLVEQQSLANPFVVSHFVGQTGGSRGPRTPVPVDLAWLRERAVVTGVWFDATGGLDREHACWGVPGAGMQRLVEYPMIGTRVQRWFTQVDPARPGLHPRYRWSARFLRWVALLAGVSLPSPVHVPLDDPLPIVNWMAEVLDRGSTPQLDTFASSAARLCQTAMAAGIDLRGAHFSVGGEPLTAARLAVIQRAGGQALGYYGSIEASRVGYGCLAPEQPDDLHLIHDLNILIQPGPDGASQGLPWDANLISSLRPTAGLILLNVSMGDRAVVTQRSCGCPLEQLGWTTHLNTVRSFEKLTAGGMTFPDSTIIRVLEEELPSRFGGGPTHYQLVEDEASDGRPRLRLLVHPVVGPVDGAAVADVFLTAIGGGDGINRIMELQWRQAGFLRVERQRPLTTIAGKVQHLHLAGRDLSPTGAKAAHTGPAIST